MGEKVLGSENPDNWKEKQEGILEIKIDEDIVDRNIKMLEEKQGNISYRHRGVSRVAVVNAQTGEITKMSNGVKYSELRETDFGIIIDINFTVEDNKIAKADFDESGRNDFDLSDRARANLQESVNQFGAIQKRSKS